MTVSDPVIYEVASNNVVWLTINRAEMRNALGPDVISALYEGLQRALDDPDARAVVITGAGDKAFSAGGNLKGGTSGSFKYDYSSTKSPFADLLRTAAAGHLPLIARVNGHCMAGGMGLLSMCDMVVASANATFGLPEVKIGMFPMQVGAVIQHLIPRRKLMEMSLTGEPISAQEALSMDLVNYVVPHEQLDAKLDWLLERICNKSPTAVRRGRFAMAAIVDMNVSQALDYMAGQLSTLALTQDSAEGLAAFREKRAPKWIGK
jgi:enoyl-CoA hydratase/carnithine racemase